MNMLLILCFMHEATILLNRILIQICIFDDEYYLKDRWGYVSRKDPSLHLEKHHSPGESICPEYHEL